MTHPMVKTRVARTWAGDQSPEDGRVAGCDLAWELPLPLGESTALPIFPQHALPPILRSFVADLAEQTQTPVDMSALLCLAVCGVTLARRLTAFASWTEPIGLFVAVAMESGSRKSAVIAEAVCPLQDAEAEAAVEMAPEIRAAAVRRKILDEGLRAAETAAAKAGPGADRETRTRQAIEAAAARDAVRTPVSPRYFGDDVTPERLTGIMAEQGGRFAVISAEGGPFDMMSGRYSDGVPNLDVYLKGHGGDTIRVDRVGRPSEQIERPSLSVVLAIQPDVLCGLADKPGLRGRGLLARFLYAIPATRVGRRHSMPPPMSGHVRSEYHALIRRLLSLPIPDAPTPSVRLGAPALALLVKFMDELEPRIGEAGDLAHMADWAGKLTGAIVRISAINHMVKHSVDPTPWEIPVTADTMGAAIEIGSYLTEHARAAFALMGADLTLKSAAHLRSWVSAHGGTQFVERDAFNATRGRFRKMESFRAAIKVLVEHGYLHAVESPERSGRPGRRPSQRYSVNPLWVRS